MSRHIAKHPTAVPARSSEEPAEVEISILMPCLNEAETLEACVQTARSIIEQTGVAGEVLVVDNASTDGSQEIAIAAGARVVEVQDKGYGNALIGGIQAAHGCYVLMGDADGSYDFSEMPKFLRELREGCDLVMGCRLPSGGGTIMLGAMPWKHRWIGNPILSGLGRLFFRSPVDDFHCGLRAFRREAIRRLDLQCGGMEFASEMVVKATVGQLRFSQVPITLRPDGRSRPPHLRSWRDGWRHLRFLLLFTPKWLFLYPGLLVTGLSALGFAALLPGPVRIGAIRLDTNTLLVCAAGLIVGLQMIFFAVYTKVFAVREGLLFPDRRVDRLLDSHPIEWGLAIGALLLLIGFSYLTVSVLWWQDTGFGDLPYGLGLRRVIPAVTAIALGAQFLLSGFALAVLGLKRSSRT